MKITIDLPQPLLRKAKSLSAERGESLAEFVTKAIQTRIRLLETDQGPQPPEPRWLAHFERIDLEDWK